MADFPRPRQLPLKLLLHSVLNIPLAVSFVIIDREA
jgi:hypothetical protein